MLEIIHPRAAADRGPDYETVYGESVGCRTALMKDSVTAERITNPRLLDTVYSTHTCAHTRTCREACMHIHSHSGTH